MAIETDTDGLAKKALSQWLTQLGYTQSMASELVNGKRKPSIERAAEIERATGIPAAAWADGAPLKEAWVQILRRSE